MKLMTKKIIQRIPKLYATEKEDAPIVHVKFFAPWNAWTWYATEFDGKDLFFGLVNGFEREWGYFRLSELESVRGPAGLRIERDRFFTPRPVGQIEDLDPLAS